MDDGHLVGFPEAHTHADDAPSIRGIDGSHPTMRYHERAARVTLSAFASIRPVSAKRRLPVLQSPGGGDSAGEPERAAWQWVSFGAGAIFVAWLPLSAIGLALAARMARHWQLDDPAQLVRAGIAIATIYALAIAIGAFAGGFIVGRWGNANVGALQAALAGLVAATVATVLSGVSFGFAPRSLLVVVVAAPMSALGGALGRRARTP